MARDESTRAVADDLRKALVRKQDEELTLWFGDIDAAIGVGRVIRALRLSSQPPKAGVMFPPDLARRLGEAATAALQPDDPADRWIAVLEAAAFSPVRTLVAPTAAPSVVTDDLKATTLRLGPALPQIAALLGVEIPAGTPKPKPLRAGPPRKDGRKDGREASGRTGSATARDAKTASDRRGGNAKPAASGDAGRTKPEPARRRSRERADPRPPADTDARPHDGSRRHAGCDADTPTLSPTADCGGRRHAGRGPKPPTQTPATEWHGGHRRRRSRHSSD